MVAVPPTDTQGGDAAVVVVDANPLSFLCLGAFSGPPVPTVGFSLLKVTISSRRSLLLPLLNPNPV